MSAALHSTVLQSLVALLVAVIAGRIAVRAYQRRRDREMLRVPRR